MIRDLDNLVAPSLEDFSALAKTAFAGLPPEFRALCGNVVVHVADFAEDEILDDLGIEDPFELTGLYEGVDVTEKSLADPQASPDHVHLYRRPLLEEWADRGDVTLGELVTHVLVHEIGHHFGLSDEAMHEIEDAAG
ncbi:MAG: metallopeptidase family protein [Pseudomonadota bacterium]|nr:metallopeptidase family protein [Pseudomonadota bacterium]